MNINWHLVALIVGFAFYGFLAWLAAKRLVSSGLRQIRKLPRAIQAFFLIVAIIATVEAQKANSRGAEGQHEWQQQCQRRDERSAERRRSLHITKPRTAHRPAKRHDGNNATQRTSAAAPKHRHPDVDHE